MSGLPAYTFDDIRRAVGQNALNAGQAYQARGRVVSFEVDSDRSIRSRSAGSERRPYEQRITIGAQSSGKVVISGLCSCPVGHNCKHMAAALIEGTRRPKAAPLSVESQATQIIPPPPGSTPITAPQAAALPSELSRWLDELDRVRTASSEDYPETVAERLVYVLAPARYGAAIPRLGVNPISTRLLKDGRFSETASRQGRVAVRSRPAPRTLVR